MKPIVTAAVALFLVSPLTGSAQEYYADVRPILEQNCTGCHTEGGVAFSMDDAEATYGERVKIGRMVTTRQMPPWLAEAGHQEYVGDRSLSDDEVEIVRRWVANDYARGNPTTRTARASHRAGFDPDLVVDILPGRSYLPEQERDDDYRCFVVDWPSESAGYITGFRTVPGNATVAHHTVVYSAAPDIADQFRELPDESGKAGYQCFNGAAPDRLGGRAARAEYEATHPDGVRRLYNESFWLAHWAPGMFGESFPEGTGIPMEPGSVLVVQMHYYTPHAPGQTDEGTRLEFTVEDEVDRPAFHYPLTRSQWLGSADNGSMVIAPGSQGTYEVSNSLDNLVGQAALFAGVSRSDVDALEIHSANLHMHAFGHSGNIQLIDQYGRIETLLSIPKWDLAWQRDFFFTAPKVVPADQLEDTRIRVECTYENTTDGPVYGGFGSYDEMCFNFSYIAVKSDARKAADPASSR